MRLTRTAQIKGEGAVGLLVIILLLLGGIAWWLYSSRQDAQKNAHKFVTEVARRVAINYDEKYLHIHLSPDAQKTYLRSSRDRLLDRLREFGPLTQPIEVEGNVVFTSYFFDPRGSFHAKLKYAAMTAQLDLDISRGMTVWQVDAINLSGTPPPTATPAPTPEVSPTPTPTPTPAPQQKQRRKRNR